MERAPVRQNRMSEIADRPRRTITSPYPEMKVVSRIVRWIVTKILKFYNTKQGAGIRGEYQPGNAIRAGFRM